jgi:hypothetical protein
MIFALYNLVLMTLRSKDNNHDLINWNLKLTGDFGKKILSICGRLKVEKRTVIGISNHKHFRNFSFSSSHGILK